VALVDSPGVDLERLIAALGPSSVVGQRAAEVADLAYAVQAVESGAVFFCVPGRRFDGHEFAAEAVEKGAVALVVERPLDLPVSQLVVTDSRAAMAVAAAEFFGRPSRELTVAAVTGTSGKTTSSFLLFAVLAAAGLRPGLLGTIETRIGGERRPAVRTTAEAIDLQRVLREMVDAGDRSCAMEATSHGSELKRLLGVRFSVLVFTNLGRDHLDQHGTLERYYDAKRRLFVESDPPPPAAVNVTDAHGRSLAEELRTLDRAPVLTFGWTRDADVRPESLELGSAGARFTADGIDIFTPLLGRFNVENVLGVVAAARLLDLPDRAIATGVASVRGVPGRFEAVEEGQPFLVVVDYAHKPDALGTVLETARGLAEGRVICVFGCGGDRDRSKRPLMGRIASEAADVAIVTSDNPRSEDPEAIIAEILQGVATDVEVEPDRRSAIQQAVAAAQAGDVVVIAGKGHELGQEAAGRVTPFDDREVAREALRRLGAPT
jgi:UDP-N-acetylmuramoyl-L-alanyl-D-glutamate--2,6-diaminopimelate ligase